MRALAFRAETSSSFPVLREAHHRLARYDLRFELASGGMATVYLAYIGDAMGVGRVAAVKVIHPHLAKEKDYVEMFLDEARLASLISHPNVCGVYDFGESDGTYFIAMEYLRGEPLGLVQRAIRRRAGAEHRRDVPRLAARLVAEAAEGLHAAHVLRDPATGRLLNVVHRDVSPHNVVVTYDGAVRVVDFGVALAEGRMHHTKTGTVKGKFAYMAPEQMRAQDVDHRADVWALGVLLWETIALRRLFRRTNDADAVMAVTQDPIPRLREVMPYTPRELDRIAHKALQRDRDQRYDSARDMANDLNAFLATRGRPMGTAEVSAWMHAMFPRRIGRKQQLVQIAAQGASSRVHVGLPDDDELAGSSASLAAVDVDVELEEARPDRLKRGAVWASVAVSALLALALFGIGLSKMLTRGAEDEGRAAKEASSHAAEGPARAPDDIEVEADLDFVRGGDAIPEVAVEVMPRRAEDSEATAPAEIDAHPETALAEGVAASARASDAPDGPRRAARPRPARPSARARHARAPAERPASVAGPNGRVALVTLGAWAEVWEGGRHLGQTPGTFELSPGRHVLRLQPFGATGSRMVPVHVRAGQTTRTRVDLR